MADIKLTDPDNDSLYLADDVELIFGSGADANDAAAGDVTMSWDGTDLDVVPTTDNSVWKWGTGTAGWDMWWYGSTTANNIILDASADDLTFDGVDISLEDSDLLQFGDANDITMAWDGTDFDVLQATANSSIKWGVDGAGIDQVWYGDAASANMTWDQSADDLIFSGAAGLIVPDGQLTLNATAITATGAEINGLDASAADGCAIAWADTQLTATNVNNLAATNIELVAAPGAGLAVYPVAAHFFMDHGGTDFVQTNAADHLALLYTGSNEIAEMGSEAQCTALMEASADAALYVPVTGAFVPEANKAIDLDNNGAAEYATGNGTLSVRVFYRVMRMAAFT